MATGSAEGQLWKASRFSSNGSQALKEAQNLIWVPVARDLLSPTGCRPIPLFSWGTTASDCNSVLIPKKVWIVSPFHPNQLPKFLLFAPYVMLNHSLKEGSDFQPICMHSDAFQVTSEEIGKTPAVSRFPYKHTTFIRKLTWVGPIYKCKPETEGPIPKAPQPFKKTVSKNGIWNALSVALDGLLLPLKVMLIICI